LKRQSIVVVVLVSSRVESIQDRRKKWEDCRSDRDDSKRGHGRDDLKRSHGKTKRGRSRQFETIKIKSTPPHLTSLYLIQDRSNNKYK
jgi:hypothetical protein